MLKAKVENKKRSVDQAKQWYVLYCKPNTEKSTTQKLKEKGFDVYCPTQTQIRQWSDRKKKIEKPVLPSMLLVYIKDKDRPQAFTIPSVQRYLFFAKEPSILYFQKKESIYLMTLEKNGKPYG